MNNIKKEKYKNIFSFFSFEKIALILLAISTVLTLYYSYNSIVFPYEMDYVEGLLIHYSKIPIQDLYNSLASDNMYNPVLYSPTVIVFFSFLSKIIHINPFILGRIFSFLCILGITFLIYRVVYTITKKHIPGILSALWFLCFPLTVSMYSVFRVDQFGALLALAGFFMFFLGGGNRSTRYISVCLLALATFVKVTFILSGLAFVIVIILQKRKKDLHFIYFYAGLLILLHGGMELLSNGTYFLNVIWYSMLNDYSFMRGLFYLQLAVIFFIPFTYYFIKEKNKIKSISFPLFIYIIIMHLILPAIFRRGVNVNFFFEFTAVWSVVIGIMYWILRAQNNLHKSIKQKVFYNGIFYYFFLFPVIICSLLLIGGDINFVTSREVKSNYQVIDQYVRDNEGIYLSERNGFLVNNNKGVVLDSFQISSISKKIGNDQENRIIASIKNNEYRGIIIKKGRSDVLTLDRPFSIDILNSIDENYIELIDNDNFTLFIPDN
ncbi:MAG: hypothetical protein WCW66_06325 [Patescibacteria group bacterium]|jgi:hypothetical protein